MVKQIKYCKSNILWLFLFLRINKMEKKKEFHEKLMFACEYGNIDQINNLLEGRRNELDDEYLPLRWTENIRIC